MNTWRVSLEVTDCPNLHTPMHYKGKTMMYCDVACARSHVPCRQKVTFSAIEADTRDEAIKAAALLARLDRPWATEENDVVVREIFMRSPPS